MGFFGFGKKRHHAASDAAADDDAQLASETDAGDAGSQTDKATTTAAGTEQSPEAAVQPDEITDDVDEAADEDELDVPTEAGETYEGRGEFYGPWDVDDEDVPDYAEYLDLGAFYLPFLSGIELRIKASRSSKQVLGCTITYGSSSLEVEAFAAPKTLGLWDDMRDDLLSANAKASGQPGIFGTEVLLPVALSNGKRLTTRIVAVDGPRWMLRGIFSGKAARSGNAEYEALNAFFSKIVVARGEEPLAPRDLIPMHPPVSPAQRKAAQAAEADAKDSGDNGSIPGRPKGPFNSDQQTEVKSTLSRGPMFSEVR